MRAYFFGNMYLSQIQQGIQALHCTSEMFVKYNEHSNKEQSNMLHDWAEEHKTVILLNAGYSEAIRDLVKFFHTGTHAFPFAEFCESKEALDDALTCVGIILPPKIYDGAKAMRKVMRRRRDDQVRLDFEYNRVLTLEGEFGGLVDIVYTEFEVELMERLNTFGLA